MIRPGSQPKEMPESNWIELKLKSIATNQGPSIGPAKGHAGIPGSRGSPKITLSLATTPFTSTVAIRSGFRSHDCELDTFKVWYQITDTKNHTTVTKFLTRPQNYLTNAPVKFQTPISSRSSQESRASCLTSKCNHKSELQLKRPQPVLPIFTNYLTYVNTDISNVTNVCKASPMESWAPFSTSQSLRAMKTVV